MDLLSVFLKFLAKVLGVWVFKAAIVAIGLVAAWFVTQTVLLVLILRELRRVGRCVGSRC